MGVADRELVNQHVGALLSASKAHSMPPDLLGRLLLEAAIDVWRQHGREVADIAAELNYQAENLDPSTDIPFMRP